jgi:CRISPR-associated protein Cas1
MAALILDQHGTTLGFEKNQLVLKGPEREPVSFPIHQVDRILVTGTVHFSHAALRALLRQGIPTLFCSAGGWLYGHIAGESGGQVRRRARQYQVMTDSALALAAARQVVRAKLSSQTRMLHQWDVSARGLTPLRARMARSPNLDVLRGFEGRIARTYFEAVRQKLRGTPFRFERREHHPAPDPINALLSLGYTLLLGEAVLGIHGVGLDRFAGVLHSADGSQPAFALDLIEPLRVIVDRLVVRLAHDDYTPEDFVQTPDGCRCRDGRRGVFYRAWEELLAESVHWQGEAYTYRRLIHEQAVRWARWFDHPGADLELWSMP